MHIHVHCLLFFPSFFALSFVVCFRRSRWTSWYWWTRRGSDSPCLRDQILQSWPIDINVCVCICVCVCVRKEDSMMKRRWPVYSRTCNSSSERCSPSCLATCRKFLRVILPFWMCVWMCLCVRERKGSETIWSVFALISLPCLFSLTMCYLHVHPRQRAWRPVYVYICVYI